jgi:nitrate reductase NapE component
MSLSKRQKSGLKTFLEIQQMTMPNDDTEPEKKLVIPDFVLIALCVFGLVSVLAVMGLIVGLTIWYSQWFLFLWGGLAFYFHVWTRKKRNGE